MPTVHPTALVDPEAELAEGVAIGPYAIVEGPVTLGEGVTLTSHNHVRGPATIGAGSTLFPFASVGMAPQHLAFDESQGVGGVVIGRGVTLRENATVHQAWHTDAPTRVGDRCYFMAGSHVGHDAVVGDDCIVCNCVQISGHCVLEDRVYCSGLSAIHQYGRVGRQAMISAAIAVSQDVPPYCLVAERNMLGGLNTIGMRRAGIPAHEINAARRAYNRVFRASLTREDMQRQLDELADGSETVAHMAAFVRGSTRGIVPGDGRPRPMVRAWIRRAIRGERELAPASDEA
jgi:UDP-N-acetylglucosamine acyltransferase